MSKKYHNGSGMINSDPSQMANLPQNVIIKKYPDIDYTMNEGLDCTIKGVDRQINGDARGGNRKSSTDPSMW